MPNDLVAVIKQKQVAIAKLQAELDEARALLTGETRPRPQIARQQVEAPATRAVEARRSPRVRATARAQRAARGAKAAKGEIVPTSSVGRTVEVLKRAGKPLHVDEIIKQIEAEGHKVNKTTLVGNFSRYVKAKRVFYRAAPSVFGLLGSKKES